MAVASKRQYRKEMCTQRVLLDGLPRRCGKFFLDSGAHALYTLEVIHKKHANGYEWFKSKEFIKYVRKYGEFCKENQAGMDFYANVDVIFNPTLTYQVQKFLESEYGISPIPVIHYGTPLKWIDKYLDEGYKFLGIGGLGQEAPKAAYLLWADRLYDHICPRPERVPIVKTHGFAMTAYQLILRYPWYSVDSASAYKAAGFGSIYVPHKRDGEFTFGTPPYTIAFSHRSGFKKNDGKHYDTLTPAEKKIVCEWLELIAVPFGKMDGKTILENGVSSQYYNRAVANIHFFDRLCKWLPKWPWAFKIQPKTGFMPWGEVR